jgi:hypothetical protein
MTMNMMPAYNQRGERKIAPAEKWEPEAYRPAMVFPVLLLFTSVCEMLRKKVTARRRRVNARSGQNTEQQVFSA